MVECHNEEHDGTGEKMMQNTFFKINNIPIVLWGEPSEKVIIVIQGDMSSKTEMPIENFAREALENNYQVLSFDLPEQLNAKGENTPCKIQHCMKDMAAIMAYTKPRWKQISLFANSIGSYFNLFTSVDETQESNHEEKSF